MRTSAIVNQRVNEALRMSEKYIGTNPKSFLAGAFLLGAILGWWTKRK